ncbi:unnamed protein product, partial [Rotaria sordida]
ADQKRQAAMEKERKARQARMKKEREEARQKLHDKNQADDGSTIRKMNLSINDNDKMILDDYSSSAEKNYEQKDGNSKEENGDIDLIEESK